MKNKKVCIFTAVHDVFDTRIFHREAKTVARAGYEVVFLVQHDKEEIVDNIRIVPLPRPKNRFERMTIEVWKLLRLGLREKADVYHFHDPELILVGLILKLFGKKVIYDVHENASMQMQSKDWIPAFLRTVVGLLVRFIERLSLPFFDRAVIAGEDIGLQPHFRKFHHKIILIRNFPVISVPVPVALNNNNSKVRFIYTGELALDKGIDEIVRASKSLAAENFELTLLGNFSFQDFEQKILKEISGDKRIKYMPFIPYRKMFDLLVKNHVGFICFKPTPNNINALSGRNNKIYEYIEAGLAIIGSNFESWGDFMRGNKIGIAVDPSNTTEIKRAMEFFIQNPQRMKIMQENAKKLSIKYSWKAESRKLLDLYEGLLS